ncbi:hypothetical protein [Motilibacter aurantiacus]|uniref:hypothetical protein n=1 Tax=Motilibacter aurantiacus TaxID=2714955 RepID=UPI001407EDD0|nr:hypothetical protein [Motilibacter aurantiacus]NHC44508.1 hypothetical protein [Motilibacter aurantiacus]
MTSTPPVDDPLEAAALSSLWLRRVTAFLDYVGGGRPLTADGGLSLDDARALNELLETGEPLEETYEDGSVEAKESYELDEVDLTYRLALAAGLIEVVDGSLARAAPAYRSPKVAWLDLLVAMLFTVGPTGHHYRLNSEGVRAYAKVADASLAALVLDLAAHGPVDLDEAAERAWEELYSAEDLDAMDPATLPDEKESARQDVVRGVRRLVELGALQPDEDARQTLQQSQQIDRDVDRVGERLPVHGRVSLSPLGASGIDRVDAGAAAALVAAGAPDVLATLLDVPFDFARHELRVWVEGNGEDAAAQLVEAVTVMDPVARQVAASLVLGVLDASSADTVEAVGTLAGQPELRPFVQVWRLRERLDPPRPWAAGEEGELVERLHAAMLMEPFDGLRGLLDALCAPLPVEEVIERLWRVRHPETAPVLEGLGVLLEDKSVAKAARKALFKHNSLPAS